MKKKILLLSFLFLSLPLFAQKETLSVQLQWLHQFQFAGFYVAKEKGFYDEAGLDVHLKEYAQGIDTVDEVVSQRSQYGIGRSSLLLARAKGAPVVALAAIYQDSPSVLITTDPKIKTPAELRGRRIMITPEEAGSAAVMGMLLANGIRRDDIVLQPHSFHYRDLIEHKTDAMACYLSNEPYLLQQAKVAFTVFDPKEYGFNFYGDLLFTSDEEIKHHPQRVEKFYAATVKGWLWAFGHIEETAALISEKYNSQHKPLSSLIREGEVLKGLALQGERRFGAISKQRYRKIADAYRLSGLLSSKVDLDPFVNPLGLGRETVRIGVLANRSKADTQKRWQPLLAYANEELPQYRFELVPLSFEELEETIRKGSVDFIFANTMAYVRYENRYGLTRIATLLNRSMVGSEGLKQYGGVIFTRSGNRQINTLKDLKSKSFGAVTGQSFGGWVMAYERLLDEGIERSDLGLRFLGTQDAVVESVLGGEVAAGTVRTDILERMAEEKRIDLAQIKVLGRRSYEGFPYLASTRLYPEWPLAKLNHTSERIAHDLVALLIELTPANDIAKSTNIAGWTIPLDYSGVHKTLKALKLPPYDRNDLTLVEVFKAYRWWISLLATLFAAVIGSMFYIRRTNALLIAYNERLDLEVDARTSDLEAANETLRRLSRTDSLTQIGNRGYFMEQAASYFEIAKRNGTPLQVLILDLDHFKQINDTYGHAAGDQALRCFAGAVSGRLRKSDLFGRIGGEEFAICLQNTSLEGAREFAEQLCRAVPSLACRDENGRVIGFTTSIGMAGLTSEQELAELLSKADDALYSSKKEGRNRLVVHGEERPAPA